MNCVRIESVTSLLLLVQVHKLGHMGVVK